MLQYSELLKRHEKEVKSNLNYVDNIASLTVTLYHPINETK